ncbi:MAG: hypothetical protein M1823_004150 [Watsoniomyces obsoletus]|nr:MAG: hypothetical protein M1823_004150 [Watsoniomyces obsoletus]
MRWLTSFLLSLVLGLATAISTTGNRVLVVLEESTEQTKYSKFWGDLESRGYKLVFESPKNDKLSLFQLGERVYDHVILLPPKSKGLGPALTPALLLKFLNTDGNIIVGLSSTSPTPTAISSLLLELDIHLPPDRTSQVVDHFNYDLLSASEKHDVLVLPQPGPLRPDVKNFFGGDGVLAFPRGVGQLLGNDSPLLAPVLRAPDTAYTYNPKDEAETVEEPFGTGSQLSLVSTLQARNSARVVVLGSVEMLEDAWFDGQVKSSNGFKKESTTANRAFAKTVSAWAFREIGVLKVGRVQHHAASDNPDTKNETGLSQVDSNPKIYRVKSDVTFSIELSEYSYDQYQPFVPPAEDEIQLEFTMLSPFYRLNLKPIATTDNSTVSSTTFTLPDQHGIFNFRVNYKRPFLTNVDEKKTVTVRHFAHDEWPRSWNISGAWVSIAGIGCTIFAWLVFVVLWLFSAPTKGGNAKKVQ